MAPTPPADGPKARDPEARNVARTDGGSEPSSREEAPPAHDPAQRVAQLVVAERRVTAPEPSGEAAEPSNAAPGPSSAAPEPVRGEAAGRRARGSEGGKRKISLEDEFLIEGKLEKPSAYYILRRSTLDYDWARLGARFSPLVLESVQDPLF